MSTTKGPFTNTCKGGGGWCKKGGPENFGARKGGPWKKTTNFTPEKWVYMIFYGVDEYFPCQKRGGGKKFWGPKEGPWKFFALTFFLHQAPPYKCLWTVPNTREGQQVLATVSFLFTWVHLYKGGSVYIKYEPLSFIPCNMGSVARLVDYGIIIIDNNAFWTLLIESNWREICFARKPHRDILTKLRN